MTVAEFQSGAWFGKPESEYQYRFTRECLYIDLREFQIIDDGINLSIR